jgi:hypothetical protein
LGGRGRRISEFEASLVYKVSSRIARATKKPCLEKPKKKKKKNLVLSVWKSQQMRRALSLKSLLQYVRKRGGHATLHGP